MTGGNPAVSVVMSAYNSGPYISEAIESILHQTFTDFEFIIIDDGSSDASGEIADSYARSDSRIIVIHQENQGIAKSLNTGLRRSTGKYIARMDSDDISLPERFDHQYRHMETHPEIGICGTGCRHFGSTTCLAWTMTDSEEIKSRLIFWPCIVHPTVMMRRDLILKHDLYYDPDFKQAEDHELWVRFARHCEVSNVPTVLLLWRNHEKQQTTACEEEILPWAGLVHREALKDFGIIPSAEELRIHLSLHKCRFCTTREYVEAVEEWLCKLLDANDQGQTRKPDTFAQVLFERWFAVCASNWELGGWVRKRFVASRLYRRGGSLNDLLRFFARVPVTHFLQKSCAGRRLKEDLKGMAFRL